MQDHTAPTDVIAFFRARTMTLYTDRRTIQTTNIDRDPATRRLLRPDCAAPDYSQPDTEAQAAPGIRGLVRRPLDPLGSSRSGRTSRWILLPRVPEPDDVSRPSLSGSLNRRPAGRPVSPVASPRWKRSPSSDVSVVLPGLQRAGPPARPRSSASSRRSTASPYTFEIIVVDDGSNDGSEVDLPTIDGIRLIRHTHNRGAGAARRTGTTAARGRIVVWTDVDMTYPNDEIPMLVKELDGFDHVVGARRTEEGTNRFFRVPAKWFIRKLASYLTETDIPDLNSGLRAFRRDVAMQYVHHLPAGFSCVTTLTMSFLVQRLLGEVRADRLLPARRDVEVPLVAGHQALPAAGRAHDAVVQPAEGVPAGRAGAARCSAWASSSTTGSTRTSGSPPTRC